MSALIATCEACGDPVTSDGYLWIDLDKAMAAERATEAWRDEHQDAMTVNELMAMPEAAVWHVHHMTCDPDREALAYQIDAEQLTSTGDLLNWTAHLMGKRWLKDTDWDELIRDAAAGTGRRLRTVAERAA